MKIIVGLGNPGLKYKHTRHNLGFKVIDSLTEAKDIDLRKSSRNYEAGKGTIEGNQIMLVKPLTFMNNSGIAVSALVTKTGAKPDELLVICDDFQLPPGKLRIRRGGSSGGHKGLESIIAALGTDEFARLRIGVGLPGNMDAAEFVLMNFRKAELAEIIPAIERATEAVCEWVANGIDKSMNKYN
ncbi:MAG: aminoacyl-tRNA hydrolase [Planctomycetes bacterium]|nr:aminoacyl-tRNA hydrolase [Planctomycetota bacterium]